MGGSSAEQSRRIRNFWPWLALITLLGAALRLFDLSRLPSGLYLDEAMNALDAVAANASGSLPVFYPDTFGRGLFQEGLYINLQALSIHAFGPTVFAARLPSAIAGTATIVGVGWLAKEALRSRSGGLIAAFLVATSYWAINFSRIAFTAILVPLVLSFACAALLCALRTRHVFTFAASGTLFGLGIHTYAAFRVVPLLLLLVLPFVFVTYRAPLRRALKAGGAFVVGGLVVAGPMLIAIVEEPRILTERASDVSVLKASDDITTLVGLVGRNAGLALTKYSFAGDMNVRHNLPPFPLLDPVVGLLFLIGLIAAFSQLWMLLRERFERHESSPLIVGYALLVIGVGVMVLPEVLAADGNPHALRSIGSQPFVFALAAIPLVWFVRRRDRVNGRSRVLISVVLVTSLALSVGVNVTKYFRMFRNSAEQHVGFDADLRNISDFAAKESPSTQTFIAGLNLISQTPIRYLSLSEGGAIHFVPTVDAITRPSQVLVRRPDLDPNSASIIRQLTERYSEATVETVDPFPGTNSDFTVVSIP